MDLIMLSYLGMLASLFAWALALAWRWRTLPAFARQVYDSNVEKGLLDGGINREDYARSYVRVEGPRAASYRCATGFVALLSLPLLVDLFNRIWDMAWRLLGAVEGPYERGFMLHTFMTFVFVMAVMVGLLYLVTAYYYHTRPPTLVEEIERLQGDRK
jgi:hypothetical protein